MAESNIWIKWADALTRGAAIRNAEPPVLAMPTKRIDGDLNIIILIGNHLSDTATRRPPLGKNVKIVDVRTHVLEAPLSQPFAYSRAWYTKRTAMIVEVTTDEGLVGWGEAYGPAHINAAAVGHIRPFLIGQDPLRTEWLWQEIYANYRDHGQKGTIIQAISAIDIALWDLKGKYLRQPIHKLMGGPIRNVVPAYATGLYRRQTGNPASYLAEEAAMYCEQGFKAVKLKVGFGVEDDVRTTRAIRKAVGSDIGLMVDANHSYDTVAAIQLGRRIEELDIGWFEEPLLPEDVSGHLEIKKALTIPIASGECEFTRYGFRDLLTRHAIDFVQPDTCSAGGLSECKKIADMATAYGIRYVPHVWGTGVAIAAALQLLAVLPSFTPPSLNRIEPMLEFDRTEHPIREVLLTRKIDHEDGNVAIPDGPGLGIEIDRDALQHFRVN